MKTLISNVKNGQMFQLQKGSTVYKMIENGYFAECYDMHNEREIEFKMYHKKGDRTTERTVIIVNSY